jgi:flagellar basal-body rod modification protein FlgD
MNIQGITPGFTAAVQQPSSMAASSSSSTGSSSSSSSTSSSSLQQTFLNLLVTELQNQDPTQPVDPTTMVGQMVSLNELDQLISINQTLQNMSSTGSSSTGSGSSSSQSSAATQVTSPTQAGTTQASAKNAAATSATAAAANALPALGIYPGTTGNSGLMNLYGSLGLPTVNPYPSYTGAK